MRILLDTHTLIWALFDDEHLNGKAREIIENMDNQIYYSAASIWEIQIKHEKNPTLIPFCGEDIIQFCDDAGYFALNVNTFHTSGIGNLRIKTGCEASKDPFDKLLVAQAKHEGMIFLTHDNRIEYFDEAGILMF